MNDELRFTLHGGKGWVRVHQVDDPICPPGSGIVTLFAARPDFVVYPEAREFEDLAGRRGNIVGEDNQLVRCPTCKVEGNKTAWVTEHGIEVILCAGCKQYIWVKRNTTEKGESNGA